MHAVIFEVWPKDDECRQGYLDIAAALRPTLEKMDGFISIERFQSLTDPGKILSLSFWRDDAALSQWRQVEAHRLAQAKGRAELLRDYHLRIAGVIRDYGMTDRDEAPKDSRERHG
jgi:heme-degrading monooxygenase HmoA